MPRFSSIILLSIGSAAAAAALAGHGADAYAPRLDCETYSEWVPGEPFGFMDLINYQAPPDDKLLRCQFEASTSTTEIQCGDSIDLRLSTDFRVTATFGAGLKVRVLGGATVLAKDPTQYVTEHVSNVPNTCLGTGYPAWAPDAPDSEIDDRIRNEHYIRTHIDVTIGTSLMITDGEVEVIGVCGSQALPGRFIYVIKMKYNVVGCTTDAPTNVPTKTPSKAPTKNPSKGPTNSPTETPTSSPTIPPTNIPSENPTRSPTTPAPTTTTRAPTRTAPEPSKKPTTAPSGLTPTTDTTSAPSKAPTTTAENPASATTTSLGGESSPVALIAGSVVGCLAVIGAGMVAIKKVEKNERVVDMALASKSEEHL